MNKKNLIITSTKNMSRQDWLAYRMPINHVQALLESCNIKRYDEAVAFFNTDTWQEFIFPCVGGSEVATVLGLDPYKASIEVFYSKVGVKPFDDFDNIAMFWGRELEEQIAQKWQYWDGSIETMMENFKAKNVVRKCHRVNAYLRNVNFPWLFVSLDREIKKWGKSKPGVLECKTMNGWVAKMWENGLPPQYVVQAMAQMATCEVDFGEIAYLKDGRDFDVLPFDFRQSIADAVIEQTKDFFDIVKLGIQHFVLSCLAFEQDLKQEHLHEIDLLAPEPDGSEGYKNYLSARFEDKDYGKPGGNSEFSLAVIYDNCKEDIKVIEAKQQEASNKLKAFLGEANVIDFGAAGKVSWKANAKGTRTFRVDIKRDKSITYENTQKLIEANTVEHIEYVSSPIEEPEMPVKEEPKKRSKKSKDYLD